MLKKNPPPWSTTQTKAIQILKEKLQHLPALQIPYDGKRILQTDASDKYWGAILFKELEGKRHIREFKSGRFIDAELHYHSTFKEILAVKERPTKEVMALRTSQPRPIMMYRTVALSSSKNSVQAFLIPPNLNPEFPSEVMRLFEEKTFHQKTRDMMFEYQLQVFKNFGGLVLKPFVPEELKWFLWYFTRLYHVSIQFSVLDLKYFLCNAVHGNIQPKYQKNFTFLSWFHPFDQWLNMITNEQMRTPRHKAVIIFYIPQYFVQCGRATQLGSRLDS
uniref:Reverse transcriptase/retrotransposon-derived protein RNase H-like domain-containing protein n=1 Tax=Gossypium raimondii TaxID=29730 RepID=A0A0D2PDU4_GOSRA|nr:hypothetical protein B456_007G230600 [Gossypium raimondii]